jgi:hypothetical protein
MALSGYSKAGGVVAADFEDVWNDAVDTSTNGYEQVGFTHLSDIGLPKNLHIPTHREPVVAKVRRGEASGLDRRIDRLRVEDRVVVPNLRDFLDMVEDYTTLLTYFQGKKVEDKAAREMAAFAAANRNYLVRHGLIVDEWKASKHKETRLSGDWAEFHALCENEGVNDEMRGKLLGYVKVPMSVQAMAFEFSGLNNYSSNHATTGKLLPLGQLRIYSDLIGLILDHKDPTIATYVTDMCYVIFHPCSKTLYYYFTFGERYPGMIKCCRVVWKHWQSHGAFMDLRKPKLPAGTAALALVQRVMKPLAESGFILIIPTRSVVDSLKGDLALVIASPFAYHPGARYLEVDPASLSTDMYKEFLADAGHYIKQNNLLKTIMKSPVMAAAMQVGPNPAWAKFVDSVVTTVDLSDAESILEKVKRAGGGDFTRLDLNDEVQTKLHLDEAKLVSAMSLDATARRAADMFNAHHAQADGGEEEHEEEEEEEEEVPDLEAQAQANQPANQQPAANAPPVVDAQGRPQDHEEYWGQ